MELALVKKHRESLKVRWANSLKTLRTSRRTALLRIPTRTARASAERPPGQPQACRSRHRASGLGIKPREGYVRTTDSSHHSPVYPNPYRNLIPARPTMVWVADFTHVRITVGLCYLAVILGASSRKSLAMDCQNAWTRRWNWQLCDPRTRTDSVLSAASPHRPR